MVSCDMVCNALADAQLKQMLRYQMNLKLSHLPYEMVIQTTFHTHYSPANSVIYWVPLLSNPLEAYEQAALIHCKLTGLLAVARLFTENP